MDKDTQLPTEILESIELKAEHEAALQFHPVYSPDQNTACRICYRNGAKEYATKLLLAQQENKELKDQIEKYVLDGRDKDFKARTLLEKFISRHEAGLLPDRFIYQEIKTFLDGKK